MTHKLNPVDQLIAARVAHTVLSSMPDGTVKSFLFVLGSKLIQQDARESKKYPNPNRLPLLLQAKERVEGLVKPYLDRDDEEAMKALKTALLKCFNKDFPPQKNLFKQIGLWETRQVKPSITAR